jgi:hypothetical protein
MFFFIGWHQPVNGASGCAQFDYAMISVNRLLKRKSDFPVKNWILDSGAFSRISQGIGHLSTRKYAHLIRRWSTCGTLMAAVSQDYLCEPFILNVTGLTVQQHQRATIARYDSLTKLLDGSGIYLMPVLQGYASEDYVQHITMYGDRLQPRMWVGVGSLCKRNRFPSQIESILLAIKGHRADLKLHGFGLKKISLGSGIVHDLLHSADSQAHGVAALYQGMSQNDPTIAIQYLQKIEQRPIQHSIFSILFTQ